jgi:hypothetical protein
MRLPLIRFFYCYCCLAGLRSSGKRGLAVRHQHAVMRRLRGQRVILLLEPHKLGFQVSNALLEAAHLRYHAGIGTANVAEKSLRHGV